MGKYQQIWVQLFCPDIAGSDVEGLAPALLSSPLLNMGHTEFYCPSAIFKNL